jgi:hypothetical protein
VRDENRGYTGVRLDSRSSFLGILAGLLRAFSPSHPLKQFFVEREMLLGQRTIAERLRQIQRTIRLVNDFPSLIIDATQGARHDANIFHKRKAEDLFAWC